MRLAAVVVAAPHATVGEAQFTHALRVVDVAAIHQHRLAHQLLDMLHVQLLELVPFGYQHQRIGSLGYLVGIVAVRDAVAQDTPRILHRLRVVGFDLCPLIQQQANDLYLSVITLLELQVGLLSLQRRDETAASHLRTWIDNRVLPEFASRILPIELDVVMACSALHVPTKRPDRDAMIAATALVHNFTVVTRNIRDFEPMGVKLLNPWTIP